MAASLSEFLEVVEYVRSGAGEGDVEQRIVLGGPTRSESGGPQ
jgi:hypothetical protein